MHHAGRRRYGLALTVLAAAFVACALGTATVAARSPGLEVFSRRPIEGGRLTLPRSGDQERQAFRKEPYLIFTGDPDAMEVHWQLYAAAPCTVAWGLDTTYSLGSAVTSEYGDDHQHTYSISGLVPATPYFYQVRTGGEARVGSFRSPPSPGDTRLKFLAYGDTRTYPATHDSVAAAMVDAYQADPEFQTLALHVGDLVSGGNSEEVWDDEFFHPTYENLAEFHATVPTQAALGNHEQSAVLFAKYFPYPFVIGRAWSFDYGPAHFVLVDQYVSYDPGSAQLAWIEDDLAATDRPWKFMVIHEPGCSAGGHANELDVQDYLHPLCVRHGVQIVFAGHNHYYARAVVDGINHVTTGGGGAPLYTPDPGFPYVAATAEEHHYCTIEIAGDSLAFAAVNCVGETLDAFSYPPSAVADGLPGAPALQLDAAAPSPSSGETSLAFRLEEPTRIDLAIYDVGGRLVRSLLAADLPAGTYEVTWDGTSDAGERVASGVYFVRLSGPRDSVTRRLVRIR